MIERYRTVTEVRSSEIEKVKGSRFVATLGPAADRAAAQALLEEVRRARAGARHHCFAWRLGPAAEDSFAGDAGEPSGSAGRPILQQLEASGVTNAMLVVSRWFGGTLLGVGGLMRAYGRAAAEVLAAGPIVTVPVTRRLVVEHPYECSGAVEAVLAAARVEPGAARYGAEVRLELDVPVADLAALLAALSERSAGRARVSVEPGA